MLLDEDPFLHIRPITNTPVPSVDEDGWSSEDEGIELAEEDEDKVCYGAGDYSEGTGQLLQYYMRQERGDEQRGRHATCLTRSTKSAPVGGPGHPIVVPTARSHHHHHPAVHRPTTACSHLKPPTPPPNPSKQYTRVGGYYVERKPGNQTSNRATSSSKSRFNAYMQIHRPMIMKDKYGFQGQNRSPSPRRPKQPIAVPAATLQTTQSLGEGTETLVGHSVKRPATSHHRRPATRHSVT